jgi:hypothetical protein
MISIDKQNSQHGNAGNKNGNKGNENDGDGSGNGSNGNGSDGNGNGGDGNSGNGNGNNGNGNGGNGNGNNGNGPKDEKKVLLTIIVSGTATIVEANPNQKMRIVAQKALEQTGNTARPLEEWTLKTRDGSVLEFEKTVEHYGFADGAQLIMSLSAGVGGQY